MGGFNEEEEQEKFTGVLYGERFKSEVEELKKEQEESDLAVMMEMDKS